MSDQTRVESLVARWEHARENGIPLSPADVCADAPELLPAVQNALRMLYGDTPGGSTVERGGGGQATDVPPDVPGFELRGEVGRGGMGIVYRAVDRYLGREVAVKVLFAKYPAGGATAERFRDEARITGQLQHPGVPAVYQGGSLADGRPYLAMKLIRGHTLDKLIEDGTVVDPLGVFEAVVQAVAYAHAHRVIHRDLKPQNVMVGQFGQVQVMDWGLAKVLSDAPAGTPPAETADKGQGTEIHTGRASADALTEYGSVMGTPAYMAPEQAAGESDKVDARSDVFGLGGVLCALLTGHPPFNGASSNDVRLKAVRGDTGEAFERLDKCGAEAAVVELCKRCLAFQATDRPADAQIVADAVAALRREKDDRTKAAELERERMAATTAEREKRWRVQLLLGGAVLATALLGAAVGVGFGVEARRQEGVARQESVRADGEATEAERQRDLAIAERNEANEARRRAEITTVDSYTSLGVVANEQGQPAQAALWFASAAHLAKSSPDRERYSRVRVDSHLASTPTPVAAFKLPAKSILSLSVHPSGTHVLARTATRVVVWDVLTDTALSTYEGEGANAYWSPSGDTLAVCTARGGDLISFPDGKMKLHFDLGQPIRQVAFSDGGKAILFTSQEAQLWDYEVGKLAAKLSGFPADAVQVELAGNAERVVVGSWDGRVRVFDTSGTSNMPLFNPLPSINGRFALTDGGKTVVTVTGNRAIIFSDLETGKEVRQRTYSGFAQLLGIRAGQDQDHFVVFGFNSAEVWRSSNAAAPTVRRFHANGVLDAAINADAQRVLTVSMDRTAQLFTKRDYRSTVPPLTHTDEIPLAAISKDGNVFATGQHDGLVRVWCEAAGPPRYFRSVCNGIANRLIFSGDQRHCLPVGSVVGGTSDTQVIDTATGDRVGMQLSSGTNLCGGAFSPGSNQLCLLRHADIPPQQHDAKGGIQFWDWKTGRMTCAELPTRSMPVGAVYAPKGNVVAAVCRNGDILILDPTLGKLTRTLNHGSSSWVTFLGRFHIRFTPDGKRLLTWGLDNRVKIWDTETWWVAGELIDHKAIVHDVAISPDGNLLATSSQDKSARVWNLASGEQIGEPFPHTDWVFGVQFHPSGHLLITTCRDKTARVWDMKSGQLACPPFVHPGEVDDATFTPDGEKVVTTHADGGVRVWEWATGKPLTPDWPLTAGGLNLRVTNDGEQAIASTTVYYMMNRKSTVEGFRLSGLEKGASDKRNTSELVEWCEVVSGQTVHRDGGVVNLTSTEWFERWNRVKDTYRRPPAVSRK